jgi:hypothetical protein
MERPTLDQLMAQFSDGARAADVWRSFSPAASHAVFCNDFARHVGESFLNGSLTYELADRAMNGLYIYCYHLDVDRGMPDYAFRMFNAFEESEYIHYGDTPDTIQHEKYVKPLVLELVGQHA